MAMYARNDTKWATKKTVNCRGPWCSRMCCNQLRCDDVCTRGNYAEARLQHGTEQVCP